MKRVAILVNHVVDVYNLRKELVEHLLTDGYEVYISSPNGERIVDLVAMGCHFINTPISRRGTNIFEDFKLLSHYKKIMKEVKPDIVLTYSIKPNIYGGMVSDFLEIPYIANITGLGTPVEHESILQKIIIILYKIAFKNVNCVFFQNFENMQFFEDHNIAIKKRKLIPGSGVNLKEFSVLDYPSTKTVEFLFIARIMKEKGIDQYLEAAKYIREKYPNTRFHILGFCEEEYEDKLKELQNMSDIIYHGMQSDVRKFLKITHCTIHPSYYPEGMSNVLLESAASGRPIITTNRSGCKEIIDDSINGYIVEQKNSKDLIEKIEKFLNLDYATKKRMGLAGREKVEKEFDRKIVVDAYLVEIRNSLESVCVYSDR